ncbi:MULTISPECIES: hypothetical protein [unclassified Frankia]|uniref:hypothetical protein n=1 Tax=unclassified Frankia TaxID=2632575 RepID=UPI002AD54439|nr:MULTISPECIES: hypothetical protein [unclassified Frankia]
MPRPVPAARRSPPEPAAPDRTAPDPTPPNLRVQLPYFAARIAVLVMVLVVLLILGVNPVLALLSGLVIAGVLTYPLGRMQRRAAERAAGRPVGKPAAPSDNPRS